MRTEKFTLIKPLIHPAMKPDEAPLGYLIRVAERNGYKNYRWLASGDGRSFYVKSYHRLYRILAREDWTGCNLNTPAISEALSLNLGYFISRKLRFCTMCIKELGYYKIEWQLRASVACKEHGVWLRDCCHRCGRPVEMGDSSISKCPCGADITEADTENVSADVILMQRFLSGTYKVMKGEPLLLSSDNGLSKIERLEILSLFSRWLRGRLNTKTGVSMNLRDMHTARDCMSDVAEALFSGRVGFHNFLKRLQELKYGTAFDKDDLFIKFYRAFYKDFPQECFAPYKHYLEQYMNLHWEKPLSRRNRHFDTKTLKAHPWIPFQTACREYDIHKSDLKQAIRKNLIRSKSKEAEGRKSIIVYKPDLEARLYRLKDQISAKEAAVILGLTKMQFTQLRESTCFKVMTKPGEYGNSTWHFSRAEMLKFRDSFLNGLPEIAGDYWTLPQLLQFFGGQIESPLTTVLSAVEDDGLKVSAKAEGMTGLSSMLFKKDEFSEWFERYKAKSKLLSIPATAKILGIHQQFTYQLVENGIIGVASKPNSQSRWILHEEIDEFRNKYTLLSKLAKKSHLSSRSLINYLASREIYPVDHVWENKLRQKLYERNDLAQIQILEGHI